MNFVNNDGKVLSTCGPDIFTKATGRLPPCPLVIALVPLKCFSRNLQFPHRVPLYNAFTIEKMPLFLCPFQKQQAWCAYIRCFSRVNPRPKALPGGASLGCYRSSANGVTAGRPAILVTQPHPQNKQVTVYPKKVRQPRRANPFMGLQIRNRRWIRMELLSYCHRTQCYRVERETELVPVYSPPINFCFHFELTIDGSTIDGSKPLKIIYLWKSLTALETELVTG